MTDVQVIIGPGLQADRALVGEVAEREFAALGVHGVLTHARDATETRALLSAALPGHAGRLTDPPERHPDADTLPAATRALPGEPGGGDLGPAGGLSTAVVVVPGPSREMRELIGAGGEVVWCDFARVRQVDGASHIHGRGIEGLAWAIRHAVHRARHRPRRIPYGPHPEQWGDLHLPTSTDSAKAAVPVVALVHGGYWRSIWAADLMEALCADLTARGFAAWNLEYRRPDLHGWDATTTDVAAGLAALPSVAASLSTPTAPPRHSSASHPPALGSRPATPGPADIRPLASPVNPRPSLAPHPSDINPRPPVTGSHPPVRQSPSSTPDPSVPGSDLRVPGSDSWAAGPGSPVSSGPGVLLDLGRVAVVGHSAGGQLALRAAADGAGVALAVSLAGVLDLVEGDRRHLSSGAVAAALDGRAGEERGAPHDRYASSSPLLRLPLGIPQLIVQGSGDDLDLIDFSRRYARAAAEAGDEVTYMEMSGDHFAVIDPRTPIWRTTALAIADHLTRTTPPEKTDPS
ncbi:hypothetical protein GCM10010404_51610 [Nonomuraea africana]|uniref:Acetyl esterase/lipase n=1 Tax=Nonomuraea africana TaxID=46171 RepID=A0ABR9KG66_9ACTN|nr:alpha/beta hydrolase fold domain-containing protein [Nonomuraea africana]MBE1561005.1 acetyl esterase/lipase [Nonomuraea africana]